MRKEKEMLDELRRWAESREDVRGLVMNSTRTNPDAFVDLFSDYDIVVYVTDTRPFLESDAWLDAFGPIMARWPSRPRLSDSGEGTFRLVIFEDGVRIDFGIDPVRNLQDFKQDPLRDDYDNGYRILLDKDRVLDNPTLPTHTAYHIKKPTEDEYDALVDEFWWDITYVAKSLWRDELFYARYMHDTNIRSEYLWKIIEWYIGLEHNWRVSLNKKGRWFKRFLDSETWSKIESTFVGSDIEENWEALFKTGEIFSRLARTVGEALGYKYPSDIEEKITQYMLKIRNLPADADDFI